MKNVTRVMVLGVEPIDDDAITRAFKGNQTSPMVKAFVQLIENYRIASLDGAHLGCSQNNTLATGAAIGAHGILTELLDDIGKRVE